MIYPGIIFGEANGRLWGLTLGGTKIKLLKFYQENILNVERRRRKFLKFGGQNTFGGLTLGDHVWVGQNRPLPPK